MTDPFEPIAAFLAEHDNDACRGEWCKGAAAVDALAALRTRLAAAEARSAELERELQATHSECALAYGVIDELPDGALDSVPDAKLLAAVRCIEDADKRDTAETGLQRKLAAAEAERDEAFARGAIAVNVDFARGRLAALPLPEPAHD